MSMAPEEPTVPADEPDEAPEPVDPGEDPGVDPPADDAEESALIGLDPDPGDQPVTT